MGKQSIFSQFYEQHWSRQLKLSRVLYWTIPISSLHWQEWQIQNTYKDQESKKSRARQQKQVTWLKWSSVQQKQAKELKGKHFHTPSWNSELSTEALTQYSTYIQLQVLHTLCTGSKIQSLSIWPYYLFNHLLNDKNGTICFSFLIYNMSMLTEQISVIHFNRHNPSNDYMITCYIVRIC